MLTIFSIPKPFEGHIGLIQHNAIASWARLGHDCEIILCGDEAGTRAAAANCGADFIPTLTRSEYGTPLLSCAFAEVRRRARYPRLCYVNADIILLPDVLDAARRLRRRDGLIVGRRIDVPLTERWDWAGPDTELRLRRFVAQRGVLHPPSGSDYFLYWRDGPLAELPPFCVGRPGWDNWLIFRARQLGLPVVDATRVVTAIHQSHGYRHVPGGDGQTWEGPEADRNRQLLGRAERAFTLLDATHVMMPHAIWPALSRAHLARRWVTLPVRHPRTLGRGSYLGPLLRALRRIGS